MSNSKKTKFLKQEKTSSGFTIIELVISIFVLSIAIIGAYNAFTAMDILTSNSSDRFKAAYLAQEGIEIVRNIRDTNWLRMEQDPYKTWTSGLSDATTDCSSGCEADYKTFGTAASPLYPWTGRYLYINSDGFYVYETENAVATKFKRKIKIIPMATTGGEDDILKIVVEVLWDEKANIFHSGTLEDSITVEEYLYNWY